MQKMSKRYKEFVRYIIASLQTKIDNANFDHQLFTSTPNLRQSAYTK